MPKCLIVTCIPCDHPYIDKDSPSGCCNCGILDWLCFKNEELCNSEYKKQFPDYFDADGNYKIIEKK
jgi:hypothetical protein